MVTGLMSHTKFFSPDSVSGSASIDIIGFTQEKTNALGFITNFIFKSPNMPLGQPVKADNIKKSSSGMLTLKRIGIVYGTDI
ncbi:MAG: hypothetical protein EZS28_013182 [Streblomastix strix]|uniref:Uncharacterized protein n=1 Tax=Streblomastix strix TaxID=222440 RepID=A0A5J4W8U2_9EUKA|nr:MAG: hypothetical protein EZS28_013182 [Streblomastix strix]